MTCTGFFEIRKGPTRPSLFSCRGFSLGPLYGRWSNTIMGSDETQIAPIFDVMDSCTEMRRSRQLELVTGTSTSMEIIEPCMRTFHSLCTTSPLKRRVLTHQPFTLHLSPFTLHPSPFTFHPSPFTLYPSPFTLHPSPFTLHSSPLRVRPSFINIKPISLQ